ncbi:hypothetical protein [Actinokineospora cianjurensis]|uniref:Uncharacterized protein n=1 Tax=Actinokineospora cianjurensis TaxID=585224 RepID=A0A421AX90_9PSEU|nr:hypothetical protein [Actinokineospora cianjurensis]RLK54436.1 hypothetical protein CLV68_5986 [Actinokineospora cianjurensis]
MTVTFTAAMGAIVAHVITCVCNDAIAQAPRFGDYADARDALLAIPFALEHDSGEHRALLAGCTEPELCPDYPLSVRAIEDLERPEVNVSNLHAAHLLHALGYGELGRLGELFGDATPEEFRGRVLTALALAPVDMGVPSYQDGNWNEGGRQPTYFQDRLTELLDLADWCAQHARSVQWH